MKIKQFSTERIAECYGVLKKLYSSCINDSKFSICDFSRKNKVSGNMLQAFKKLDLYRAKGVGKRRRVEWNQGEPTIIMARKLLEEAYLIGQKYQATYKKNKVKSSNQTPLKQINQEIDKHIAKQEKSKKKPKPKLKLKRSCEGKATISQTPNKFNLNIIIDLDQKPVGIIRRFWRWLW